MGSSEQVFPWLKTLPLAPEYHPTLSEFQDPISYIFKIEKEASTYGICKIVPPLLPQPKKTSVANFNQSLSARRTDNDSGVVDEDRLPTFTTRQQQIGFCPRKNKPVQKPVWQSGETYTFHEFESKARNFEKVYVKKCGKSKGLKGLSALEMETLFWKASIDKPFSVEYANDMPGSAFVPLENVKRGEETREAVNVGETSWNMRGISRAKGSLLRFMKEEIPGVTSPMVYLAMMFSWFAWHVEDHDLHSLNYLHMGAGKTWYGVPRDGAAAFEEVVRVQGYGGEINPLAMFSTLGEKNTVMSPEVFVREGIPCCRLVQNPGEFVVTFPRAYHSGFSHGFNCGEAANIATPEWLKIANEAAIRRASINYPPMVSHFQLLYDLALELCSSSVPVSINQNLRSSRSKDKKKCEGETLVKELFVRDVIQNNDMLHVLGQGTSIVLLPQNSSDFSITEKLQGGSQPKLQSSFSRGLLSHREAIAASRTSISRGFVLDRDYSSKEYTPTSRTWNESIDKSIVDHNDTLSDQRLFSCVTCGILCFSCVAIIQPSEAAGQYLRSTDSDSFSDWDIGSESLSLDFTGSRNVNTLGMNSSGWGQKSTTHGLYDVPIQSSDYQTQVDDLTDEIISDSDVEPAFNALGLLALNYGNSSDSDEGQPETDIVVYSNEANFSKISSDLEFESESSGSSGKRERHYDADEGHSLFPSSVQYGDGLCHQTTDSDIVKASGSGVRHSSFNSFISVERDNPSMEPNRSGKILKNSIIKPASNNAVIPTGNTNASVASRLDEDSSRMHVFCLKHAVEVEQQLHKIGGVRLLLLCHPDYPRVEAEAKIIAAELGLKHFWNMTPFRNASKEDTECIRGALDSEEAIPGNGDWAVKMGINLFYTVILSRSHLYSKQMPYNSIIYDAFGRFHTDDSSEVNVSRKGAHRQKRIVVAGKWCGKVWMSNQVHTLLVPRDQEELEHEEKSFPDRGASDEMPGVKSETTTKKEIIMYTRKPKKRKMGVESTSTKKAKSAGHGDLVDRSDGLLEDNIQRLSKRTVKSKYMSTETVKHIKQVAATLQKKSRPLKLHVDGEKEAGPSTRLRRRDPNSQKIPEAKPAVKKQSSERQPKKSAVVKTSVRVKEDGAKPKKPPGNVQLGYQCNIEGCTMTFGSKQELALHKRNVCPVKGCGKNFFSHKYLLQHRRVHLDDRPLKCPWKGCKMSFKWAWARTEHIRVHTGARPYVCAETGCGQTFRFVSDFSRHKRKTGHLTRKSTG